MSYVVLARKWRPQRFEDVLGQEHVTRTLRNAIEADRVAHAFLFSGPRGVGKTSAARILAKALCCTAGDGPTPEPCGQCRACQEITEGRSTDVFEIDAASHTGVDNVREIIDNVRFLPASARFKIYVIDEVHMLSQGAFNALLKTLEEPPEHVKFVLATTDVHKVPVTILSRVQRYDFRRIPGPQIVERLQQILNRERVEHDPAALHVLAREAEGSMRDAQSLLEQVRAFAGDRPLDAGLVREALGVVDGRLLRETLDALLERRPGDVFDRVAEVHGRGLNLVRFTEALLTDVRDLLVARLVPEPAASLDRPADEVEALVQRARRTDAATFERLFEQLSRLVESVAESTHPRFALEVGLAAMAEAPPRVDLEALVDRLDRLLAGGGAPQTGNPGGAGSSGSSGSSGGRGRSQAAAGTARRPPAPARSTPSRQAEGSLESGEPEAPARGPTSPPAPAPQPSASRAGDPGAFDPASPPKEGGPSEHAFRRFVARVRSDRPALGAALMQVRPLRFDAGGVSLRCETAFDAETLAKPANRSYLQTQLDSFFADAVPLEVGRGNEEPAAAAADPGKLTLNEEDDAAREARRRDRLERARSHPAVKAVTESLGGSVGKVRLVDDA